MITVRYHLLSITAIFLALAVGIVVGSSTLSQPLLALVGGEQDSLSKQVGNLRAERASLQARLAAADRFSGAVGRLAVQGRLEQRTVVLIRTWDAHPKDSEALRQLLAMAGATVTGEVQLTPEVTDFDRADQLRHIATQLLPAGAQLPVTSDPGTIGGGLLGSVALLNPGSGQPQSSPEDRAAALSGLAAGGFAIATPDFQPAQLAIVLTGGGSPAPDAPDRAAVLARLATQLDRAGSGTVLAGGRGSADAGGAVAAARADAAVSSTLSTVDNLDDTAGRVATVLALRERWERQVGHYGVAASAQGPVPNTRD